MCTSEATLIVEFAREVPYAMAVHGLWPCIACLVTCSPLSLGTIVEHSVYALIHFLVHNPNRTNGRVVVGRGALE